MINPQAEGLVSRKKIVNEIKYIETKTRYQAERAYTRFFHWIFKVRFSFFMKNKSIGWWKPQYKKVAEPYNQIFIKSKSKKLFQFFSQSFEKKSYETNKITGLKA